MNRRLAPWIILASTLIVTCATHAVAQPSTTPAPPVTTGVADDPATVYRFDPFLDKLVAVPPAELKTGGVYYRFDPRVNRRVWSVARPGGDFEYAMAPGSVQPARALDLHATPEQMRAELLQRAPELAKMMDVRGGIAYVRLTEQNSWQLVRQPTIPNVFDLETGRRWEWHGERRVAVVHTGGYEWLKVEGKFVPASYAVVSYSACW